MVMALAPAFGPILGGFLGKEGLEPSHSISPPGKSAIEALLDGSAHCVQSALSQGFAACERGEENEVLHFAHPHEPTTTRRRRRHQWNCLQAGCFPSVLRFDFGNVAQTNDRRLEFDDLLQHDFRCTDRQHVERDHERGEQDVEQSVLQCSHGVFVELDD